MTHVTLLWNTNILRGGTHKYGGVIKSLIHKITNCPTEYDGWMIF